MTIGGGGGGGEDQSTSLKWRLALKMFVLAVVMHTQFNYSSGSHLRPKTER